MKNKKLICLLVALSMVLTFIPVSASAEDAKVNSFSFECHNKTGYIDKEDYLSYSFQPFGVSESVQMISSNPTVATVEYEEDYDAWIVTYHKLGTTVITATTASGLTDSCTITVAEMETVLLDQPFTVTVQPNDIVRFEFTAEAFGWYSFYSEDGTGNLCINSYGMPFYSDGVDTQELGVKDPYILAVWNTSNKVQTYNLRVRKAVPAERIIFEQEVYSGYPGQTDYVKFSIYPIWSIPEYEISCSSSNENIVYFGSPNSYWFTFSEPGEATVTVSTPTGLSAKCTVTVLDYEPIQLGDSKTLALGYQEERRYEFTPDSDGEYILYMPNGKFVETGENEWGPIGYYENFIFMVFHDGIRVSKDFYDSNYAGVSCQMKAGETYEVRVFPNGGEAMTGTFSLDELTLPDSIVISSSTETIFAGEWFSLTCESNSDMPLLVENITWSISDESVITLEEAGKTWASFSANSAGTATVTATLENGVSSSYEVIVSEYMYYDIISGNDSRIPVGKGKSLSVQIDSPIEKFNSYVSVNGIEVSEENYTVTEGSTIITLHPEYLDTLEPGWYGLYAEFIDGCANAVFEILEKPEYAMGDVDCDYDVDVDDVLALLWFVLFPEDYPIAVDADFDHNESTDVDDVLTLLWYVLFPQDYPLS